MENGRAPFVIVVVASVLLMQPPNAHAQRSHFPQQTEQEKAAMQEKALRRKEIDEDAVLHPLS
jgi:hypothetical protein